MSTCSGHIAVLSLHQSVWFDWHGQSFQKTNFWVQSFNHLSPRSICTPNQNLHSNAENGFVPLFLREWEFLLSSLVNTQVDSGLIFAFSSLSNPAIDGISDIKLLVAINDIFCAGCIWVLCLHCTYKSFKGYNKEVERMSLKIVTA